MEDLRLPGLNKVDRFRGGLEFFSGDLFAVFEDAFYFLRPVCASTKSPFTIFVIGTKSPFTICYRYQIRSIFVIRTG